MDAFIEELRAQRWDDHRYYHQSRINQSLHFLSACCFVLSYAILPFDPASAALLAWGVSMTTRQAGHFFFEPRGFDVVNHVTDDYKEAIKVGYNIRRKIVLMSVWAASPIVLWASPSLGGLIEPATDLRSYLHDVGIAWFALGIVGIGLRGLQLLVSRGARTAFAWVVKLATDPFHDIVLYHRAPLALLRGELLDPMSHARRH